MWVQRGGFGPLELPGGQGRALPVLTACQPTEKGVRACTTYMVMGLWLSAPGLQDSWAVVSVTSSMVTASGGPGGPGGLQENPSDSREKRWVHLPLLGTEQGVLWGGFNQGSSAGDTRQGETPLLHPMAIAAQSSGCSHLRESHNGLGWEGP